MRRLLPPLLLLLAGVGLWLWGAHEQRRLRSEHTETTRDETTAPVDPARLQGAGTDDDAGLEAVTTEAPPADPDGAAGLVSIRIVNARTDSLGRLDLALYPGAYRVTPHGTTHLAPLGDPTTAVEIASGAVVEAAIRVRRIP